MAHKLRIVFDGVIAVGPPHPPEGDEKGPLFAVMARSTRRRTNLGARNRKAPKYIPMHVPTVMTKIKPVDDARPADEIFQLPTLPRFYVWHPIRERLEFKFDGNGRAGTLTYGREDPAVESSPDTGTVLPTSGTVITGELRIRSVRNVPDAREVEPSRCELRAGALDPKPKEFVAAQIFVPRGHVSGGGAGTKGNGVNVEFTPLPAGRRAVSKDIVPNVVVTVEAERVEITTTSLDTGEKLDPIVFKLEEDGDIWISNGDPSDVTINLERLSQRINDRERREADEAVVRLAEKNALARFYVDRLKAGERVPPFGTFFTTTTGGGAIPSDLIEQDPNRQSQFDIDFELFDVLLKGKQGNGYPVPRKSDGTPYDERNCFCQLCCAPGAGKAKGKGKDKPASRGKGAAATKRPAKRKR